MTSIKPDGYKIRLIQGTWYLLIFAGKLQVDAVPFDSYAAAEAEGKASPLPDIERELGDRGK